MLRIFAVVFMLTLATGCQLFSPNFQRALLRASGDNGITLYLDTVDAARLDATQKTLGEVCTAMEKFIDEGNLAVLPLGVIDAQLRLIVPMQYQRWIGTVLAAVSSVNVDVSKAIGNANVRRIRSAIIGIKNGAAEYDVNDRSPPVTSAPAPGAGIAAAGG